ncbi:MAG: phosphatidylserine/phosphatidylglycerophosphate/cardiolipin synthase family protein [Candidatus Dormibacteraeota bacterium]|uniref:Phosphatidylserine/phosphatidylglycerophosphate/ cardiolipin synthase family protein n=1 Tax=Candidatus Aeolococcus gillhamiae TaxID=3127015 RepID=A0A2W5ZJY7_9BACT|nr:phosphatidylserine/phosphatidylglycerophosphate/cardiolipin synthase family protein [Candidatus Dormibacteraeota bacterium]PZR84217.1 MAG: phospholipase [Candidatus Dormibacter sp. RRmetagenome_bin12]
MDLVGGVDRTVGDLIEGAERRHHGRRLGRIGWTRALEGRSAGWAGGSTAPRDGNRLEVCVDGAAALPEIAAAIRSARRSVHVAGWAISPEFAMEREPAVTTLRELLAEAAERVEVRVLVWAGAPLPLIHPTRAEARRALASLTRGTRIRGALDARNRPMHCHHEKLVIVDGATAFVGGIDLTYLGGDRFDGAPHGARDGLGWHDAAARLSGPAASDVAAHFAMRWEATTGEHLPSDDVPAAAGMSRVQVVRTVPERTYPALPDGDFSVLEAYVGALRRAHRLIYIENQFLWSAEIVRVLSRKLRRPPSDEFRLCVVLPLRPNTGNDDTRGQLDVLMEADRDQRLLVGTVGPPGRQYPRVYVHAKIAVVDDEWLTLGSANLNEHSLFNDTEMNVVTDDAGLARRVRERLWSEHLGEDCTGADPLAVIEERWRPLLNGNAPSSVQLRPLPSTSRRAARLLGPIKGLFVDG